MKPKSVNRVEYNRMNIYDVTELVKDAEMNGESSVMINVIACDISPGKTWELYQHLIRLGYDATLGINVTFNKDSE